MHTEEGERITRRFFAALHELKARKAIRGKATFTNRYGINRWNLTAVENGKGTQKSAQLDWLCYLVRDYGVSGQWLLTGEGPMFVRRRPREAKENHPPENAIKLHHVNDENIPE